MTCSRPGLEAWRVVMGWAGRSLRLASVLAVAVSLVAGCSRPPLLVPVKGVVTLDGKPLSSGVVQFQPASGQMATGVIAGDGTFTLSRHKRNDGVPPGTYRVAVTAFDPQADVQSVETLIVPVRYTRFGSSGIEFTVFPGTTEPLLVSLTSATEAREAPPAGGDGSAAGGSAPEPSNNSEGGARGNPDSNAGGT